MFKREGSIRLIMHSGDVYHCNYAVHSQKNYMNNRTTCSTLSVTIHVINDIISWWQLTVDIPTEMKIYIHVGF